MSQIMKTYLGIFLLLLFTFTSAGFFGCFLQVIEAQDMHARFVDEIENSNYYEGTLQAVFEEARSAGYAVTVTAYKNQETIIMHSQNDVTGLGEYVDMGRVDMDFRLRIPFLGISEVHTLTSYIR